MWRVAVNSDIQRPAGSRPLRGGSESGHCPIAGIASRDSDPASSMPDDFVDPADKRP
jgi:hypothetical protein